MSKDKPKKYTYLQELKIKLVRSKYENRIRNQIRLPEQVCDTFWDLKDAAQETMIGVYFNDTMTVPKKPCTDSPVKEKPKNAV